MSNSEENPIADAITAAFGHETESNIKDAITEAFRRFDDGDQDPITIVDAVESIAASNRRIADAITPNLIGTCPTGDGHVESLTEAVMGLTKSMMMIASAIESVARAIDERT